MTYLLDTNICIYIIKKKPVEVFDKFLTLTAGSVAISSITLAELQYGIAKSMNPAKNEQALAQFLAPLNVLEFDTHAAVEYGDIRADLEKRGIPIGPLDLLIAAHAKSSGFILVTNNEREFNRVSGLQTENWIH